MAIRENPTPRPAAPAAEPSRPVVPGSHAAAPIRAAHPAAGSPAGRPTPKRPDPRPMRLAVAAGGFAALSALIATISTAAVPTAASVVAVQADPPAAAIVVRQVTRVVKLPPGVAAPANAGPNVLVTQLPAPVAKPKTVVVTTTQSGRVVKP
jgi:hypothetical protein